jgi:hypothetical protein
MFKFLLYHQGGRGWRPAPRRRAARLVVGESERWRADGWVAATRVVGGCDRPPLKKQGFVTQDHIGGFSMKREYANTTQRAYTTNIMKLK